MKLLALPLLAASCAAMSPDYLEVSPFYADGSSSGRYADAPLYAADDDAFGVMVTVGWAVGQMGEAYRNLSMLDVSKAGQLTLREPAPKDGVTVNVGEKEDKPEEPEPKAMDVFKGPPKTREEAYTFALWFLAISLGFAVLAYSGALKFVWRVVLRRGGPPEEEAKTGGLGPPPPSPEEKVDIKEFPK